MQFCTQGPSLVKALASAARIIPRHAARPILSNVLLAVNAPGPELIGTDMEIAIRISLDGADGLQEGEILAPCARLQSVIKGLGKGPVTLAAADGKLAVSRNGAQFSLVGDDPAEFPVVPAFPDGQGFTMPGKDLAEMICKVAYAAAAEESRYAIHGILMDIAGGQVRLVGTDGKRLAVATAADPCPAAPNVAINIPARTFDAVRKEIGKGDPAVQVYVDKAEGETRGRIFLKVGTVTITAAGIDGTFPAWEEVAPPSFNGQASLGAKQFAECVRQVGLMAAEGGQAVGLDFQDGQMTARCKTSNVGEAVATMPATIEGDPATIHFNPRYVLDFLKVAGDTVRVQWTDSRSAVAFRPGDSDAYTYVVMPITLEAAI